MKRLIVTADDAGLHRGMTEGAIRAHEQGIVTACSIVANGAAFDHAAERLRDFRSLAIGVHLALVEERPLSTDVPSLSASSGLFHESWVDFVPRYYARRVRMEEVDRELRAQIERVLERGLVVSHLNSHQHLHMLPRIFEIVRRLADEYRIPYVRIVDERRRFGRFAPRGWSIAALSRLGRRARASSPGKTNDGTIGVESAGHLRSWDTIAGLLDDVGGLTELVAHPAIGEEEIAQSFAWGYEWEAETRALCDAALKEAIAARGILLVNQLTIDSRDEG